MKQIEKAHIDVHGLLSQSKQLHGGMGAVAWATLEMFKRGGMDSKELEAISAQMEEYFSKPSDSECNAILKVLETRLGEDQPNDSWYS